MKGDIKLRHGSKARKERYNEAPDWALRPAELKIHKSATLQSSNGHSEILWGEEKQYKVVIIHRSFQVQFWSGQDKQVVLNDRGLLNIEHWRPKAARSQGRAPDLKETASLLDESTWWEEEFRGFRDSKPRGPESVALDISFTGFRHTFGLAEHASSLQLKETRGGEGNYNEPYRLFNTDVFEYDLDSPMTLYGSIPLMQAHKAGATAGVFWLNAAETWIDIVKKKNENSAQKSDVVDTQTHWMSESGRLDLFVMLTDSPKSLSEAYGELTGFTTLPAISAIGYHQCRWNYISDEDVKDVDRKFDKFSIPYDAIWLDIEYTDDKQYFTWDPFMFPEPYAMQKQLHENGRKLVIIINPHIKIKEGFHIVQELREKDLAIKDKDEKIYTASCWPGSSHWIDAFNPDAQLWWKSLFTYDKFYGTTRHTWLENDISEPSVFYGPELTSPRDNLHYGN